MFINETKRIYMDMSAQPRDCCGRVSPHHRYRTHIRTHLFTLYSDAITLSCIIPVQTCSYYIHFFRQSYSLRIELQSPQATDVTINYSTCHKVTSLFSVQLLDMTLVILISCEVVQLPLHLCVCYDVSLHLNILFLRELQWPITNIYYQCM